jgi:hypothetical protein
MTESNFMMALLKGRILICFLEPLVEDVLELWSGVSAYDGLSGKMFNLCAAILWCIHDYPALSPLSGHTTKG